MRGDPVLRDIRDTLQEILEEQRQAVDTTQTEAPGGGAGRGIGSIGAFAAAAATAGGALSVLGDRLSGFGGLLGGFGDALRDNTEGLLATTRQFTEAPARATGRVTSLLEPFARAGIDVDRDFIRDLSARSLAEEQRVVRLSQSVATSVGAATAEATGARVVDATQKSASNLTVLGNLGSSLAGPNGYLVLRNLVTGQ